MHGHDPINMVPGKLHLKSRLTCSPTPERGTFVTHVLYYTVTVVVNSVIFHFCPKKRTLGDQIKEPLRATRECQKKVPDKNAKKAANKKFQIQNNLAPVFCN